MRAMFAALSYVASRSRLALATAQASGFPMNVGPCIIAPAGESLTRCATSAVHSVAARVR